MADCHLERGRWCSYYLDHGHIILCPQPKKCTPAVPEGVQDQPADAERIGGRDND